MGSIEDSSIPHLPDISSICIIGAGPGGLGACKYLLAEDRFSSVDIFEAQTEVGGVWNYSSLVSPQPVPAPSTNPHVPVGKPLPVDLTDNRIIFPTPMYEDLHTNLPKEVMAFAEKSFDAKDSLFPPRQSVHRYLIDYAAEIRHHVKFCTQVQNVTRVTESGKDSWEVHLHDLRTGSNEIRHYDAVVIASGHNEVPFIPQMLGLEAWSDAFPGAILHSKNFRTPDVFRDKKVIVIGNAASGSDIGVRIKTVCSQPLLWSIRTPSEMFGHDDRLEVPPIAEFIVKDRSVRFEDGRIEKNIDHVVFCTGYLYSFPFLESLKPALVTDGKRTRGLYKQLFHQKYPTLAIPLLCQKMLPFPMAEFQGAAIARLWAGRLSLPSSEQMELEEKQLVAERGEGVPFHQFITQQNEIAYVRDLVDWVNSAGPGGKPVRMWDERFIWQRSKLADLRKAYAKNIGATTIEELGFHFKDTKRCL